VVCAGTSDLPVAEEAVVTARLMGNTVELIADVGVAGIHRLLAQKLAAIRART
jgi:pyridinium-3,5-biscarboxylic acid mononucleotide synthase